MLARNLDSMTRYTHQLSESRTRNSSEVHVMSLQSKFHSRTDYAKSQPSRHLHGPGASPNDQHKTQPLFTVTANIGEWTQLKHELCSRRRLAGLKRDARELFNVRGDFRAVRSQVHRYKTGLRKVPAPLVWGLRRESCRAGGWKCRAKWR